MRDYSSMPDETPADPGSASRRPGAVPASVWNVLAAVFLGLTVLTCLCMLTIFINPYVALNPFPPPSEGILTIQPDGPNGADGDATATMPPLPPVWTATGGAGGPLFASTPTPAAGPSDTPIAADTATVEPEASASATPAPPGSTAPATGYPGFTATPLTPVPTSGTPYP